ncbi:hypothetical protein T492DRAFT_848634 [Pavlovales sp. CCMP2436]|nr:hypothetical protein T492DRAFT_848634 [Pavlovales sp. CCMP2436]
MTSQTALRPGSTVVRAQSTKARPVFGRFSHPAAAAAAHAPMSEEGAAVMIQRAYRCALARTQLNKRRSVMEGLALQLATGLGSALGKLVDGVLLAPVNMASESLMHAAVGKLLAVLVPRHDRRATLRMTSAGIVIGGRDGLQFDDHALAALMGGMTPITHVWVSSITIVLPMVLTVWPVKIAVAKVTIPSLDAVPPAAPAPTGRSSKQVESRTHKKAAQRRAAERWHPEAWTVSVGCFVCGVRHPRLAPGGRLEQLANRLRAKLGNDPVRAAGLEPLPSSATVVRIERLQLTNCHADFSESARLVTKETRRRGRTEGHAAGAGGEYSTGMGGGAGGAFSGIGGLFGSPRPDPPRSNSTGAQAGGAGNKEDASVGNVGGGGMPERQVYKRLVFESISASATNAHGVHVPLVQPFPLAVHAAITRHARSGLLLGLELDVVLPEAPIGWLADALARTHGLLRVRTHPTPLHAGRGRAPSLLASERLGALLGLGAGPAAHSAEDELDAVAAGELASWRRGAERALNIAASFDALDSHIRACLERRVTPATLRTLVHAREALCGRLGGGSGLGQSSQVADTAGELLWTSHAHVARALLPAPTFRQLLTAHEVLLSDETFRMLLGKLEAHLSQQVDLHRFLASYMPERAAAAEAAAAETAACAAKLKVGSSGGSPMFWREFGHAHGSPPAAPARGARV